MPKQTAVIITLAAFILISGCEMAGQNKTYSPKESKLPAGEKYILTPKAPDAPKINGAKVFGVRPGSPFLFIVPATGLRPMTFSADKLPEGLTIDNSTGLITGKLTTPGTYDVLLKATNSLGTGFGNLKIVVGDKMPSPLLWAGIAGTAGRKMYRTKMFAVPPRQWSIQA